MCIIRVKHYIGLPDVAIREQFPLTVHRVQGMIISSNVFVVASGQAYVALSG